MPKLKCMRPFVILLVMMVSWFSGVGQVKTVSGVVLGQDAKPLAGVSIKIKDADQGTVTDENGKFSIRAGEGQSLIVSYLGYDETEIKVSKENVLKINLAVADSKLNEVVVVGYGKLRRKDLTGAVSSIRPDRIENERPQSVQDILRGNVAGLAVGFSSNAKGDADLEIRGDNSLKTSSSPLVVLDGVIYPGALTDINPNDIESIDVLKDASSSAIFGARAANGIIQVTTKKGKTGKPVVNVNSSIGSASMAKFARLYDGGGFVNWRTDVAKSMNYYNTAVNQKLYIYDNPDQLPSGVTLDQWLDGRTGDPTEVWLSRIGLSTLEIENYKAGKTVNWEDQVYQKGMRQDHNISLSGKRNEFSYYWSLGYNNNEGIIVGDQFKTLRSRVNLDAKVTEWLNVGLNTQFSRRDESSIPAVWEDAYRASPYGSLYKDDGVSLRLSPTDDLVGSKNPVYDRAFQDRLSNYMTIISTLYANVKLPYGFSYQVNFSPRFEQFRFYNHQSAQHEEWARFGGGATRQNQSISSWQLDNLFKWNKTFGVHQIDVTVLVNAEKYKSWGDSMATQGFSPTDVLGYHNLSAGSTSSNVLKSNDEYSTGDALMGRVFYSLMDKYMLTLSLRRDGYSAFGLENPRAYFPAAALGWVFSEERFAKNDFLTYGKLRFSWGENGNREIGRYDAFSDMGIGKYVYYTQAGVVYESNQLFVNRMSNPNLKWEKTRAINLGLDFTIKNGLFDGSLEFYDMRTLDLLIDRKLPDIVGFRSVTANLGEVENKGFELNLNARVMDKPNFKWRAGFNFSLNRNKIIHLYGDMLNVLDADGKVIGQREADDITNKWFIGHAIDEIWDPRVLGVWQIGQEAEAAQYGQFPGDFRLKDVDNNGAINQLDYEFQGFREPRFRWNLRNEFNLLKNFTVSFSVYSYWGHKSTFNAARNSNGFPERNNSYITEYWTPENPTNEFSRIRSLAGGVDFNVYRNRSFIRLDNISIAYNVPQKLLSRASIGSLKFFGTVRNAGYYAPEWTYWDPENSGPNPRIFTFGLNLSL